MNTNFSVITGVIGGGVIAALLVFMGILKAPVTNVNVSNPPQSVQAAAPNVYVTPNGTTVTPIPANSEQSESPKVGALAGPDIPFNYLNVGGVTRYYLSQQMSATSSSVCTIQSPFAGSATSTTMGTTTIVSVGFDVTSIGSLANNQSMDISTSSAVAPYASSTPPILRITNVSTSTVVGWFPATTTNTVSSTGLVGINGVNGQVDAVLGPTQNINFRIATSSAGTFANYYTGQCHAIIEVN